MSEILVSAGQLPKLQIGHAAAEIGFSLELRGKHIQPQSVGIVCDRVSRETGLLLGDPPLAIGNGKRLASEGAFLQDLGIERNGFRDSATGQRGVGRSKVRPIGAKRRTGQRKQSDRDKKRDGRRPVHEARSCK